MLGNEKVPSGGKKKKIIVSLSFFVRGHAVSAHSIHGIRYTHTPIPQKEDEKANLEAHTPPHPSIDVPSSAKKYRSSTEKLPVCKLRRWRTILLTERLTGLSTVRFFAA